MNFQEIKKDILATLTYFNMFDYPLKKREIFLFLVHKTDWDAFEEALLQLLKESALFDIGGFYSLFNNYRLAERRRVGNARAKKMLQTARSSAALIASFPFVKAIAVSGSLSKKFAAEDADIDFFIITAKNRLWIARSFLHFFKKITFLFNLQDRFCMNYFIDESSLCILEKNIYTATEVVTLMPVRGIALFEQFYDANAWTKLFLGNYNMHVLPELDIKRSWFTAIIEKLLDNRLGNLLDNLLMKWTARNWRNKKLHQKKNIKGLILSMHMDKHFSKPDPGQFQKRLLGRYERNVAEIIEQYTASSKLKNELL